jgi:hypothetical protein
MKNYRALWLKDLACRDQYEHICESIFLKYKKAIIGGYYYGDNTYFAGSTKYAGSRSRNFYNEYLPKYR